MRKHFIEHEFERIALTNLEYDELRRLYRSWQIKQSELIEDKKALAKYKYDPQSYH